MRIESYNCDGCGELLYGKKGITFIKKTYISIKGQVTLQRADKKTGRTDFAYISDTENKENPLCFCDTECFKSYIDMKEKFHDEETARRATYVVPQSDEVKEELYGNPDETGLGGSFVIGNKTHVYHARP
jgi:hypothetical protein